MHAVVLGAGVIGISTAWHLRQLGHEVTVVDRQSGPAMETSFANAGQISVSYCEPWANKHAPLKTLKWMFDDTAPLLFRPQLDWSQWAWGLRFLTQCNDRAFTRNVGQLVALGAYSHQALKEVVTHTGIEYHRIEKGIAHYYSDQASFDGAAQAAELMQRYGVSRRVVSRDELLRIEPALKPFANRICGGTYTDTDESGDAHVFTAALAKHCEAAGVHFQFNQHIEQLEKNGNAIDAVQLRHAHSGQTIRLAADAFVVACGSYTTPLLKTVGIHVPIYPGKGYSATLPLLKPGEAPMVSMIDDAKKCAMSRLGNHLRIAGTIELSGFDLHLDTPLARKRCDMLVQRVEEVMPGVADTRTPEQGGNPAYWCGLRPATPTNIPLIGRTKMNKLWINAGHGTLGWTHGAGSGKALAELMNGQTPAMTFGFAAG